MSFTTQQRKAILARAQALNLVREGGSVQISIRLPLHLLERITDLAELLDTSRSALMVELTELGIVYLTGTPASNPNGNG